MCRELFLFHALRVRCQILSKRLHAALWYQRADNLAALRRLHADHLHFVGRTDPGGQHRLDARPYRQHGAGQHGVRALPQTDL